MKLGRGAAALGYVVVAAIKINGLENQRRIRSVKASLVTVLGVQRVTVLVVIGVSPSGMEVIPLLNSPSLQLELLTSLFGMKASTTNG